MRLVVVCILGMVSPVAIAVVSPAPAESLKSVVRRLMRSSTPRTLGDWRIRPGTMIGLEKRVIGTTTVRSSSSSAESAAKRCRPMVSGTDIRHR
jgi:hypothetical protein